MNETDYQRIFQLSVVNGQDNLQHLLPVNGWTWPRDTWLERRMAEIREREER